MTTPQAIETAYRGYRFRSRLEARWAVFFDSLGVEWEYEPEGFELPSGRYLPDFRLWGEQWVEIKGQAPTDVEALRCEHLHVATGQLVEIFVGVPGENRSIGLLPDGNGYRSVPCPDVWFQDQARYRRACVAARSARFEFGETPIL